MTLWKIYYGDTGGVTYTEDTDAKLVSITDAVDRFARSAKIQIYGSSGRNIGDDYSTFTPVKIYYDDGDGEVLKMVGFVTDITESAGGATADILSGDFLLRRRDDIFVSYTAEKISYILKDLIETYSPLQWIDFEWTDTADWHITDAGAHPNDQSENTECSDCYGEIDEGEIHLAYGDIFRDNFLNEENTDIPDNWINDGSGFAMDTLQITDNQAVTNFDRPRCLRLDNRGIANPAYCHHNLNIIDTTDNTPYEIKVKVTDGSQQWGIILQSSIGDVNLGNSMIQIALGKNIANAVEYWDGAVGGYVNSGENFAVDTWYKIVIKPNYAANTYDAWFDNILIANNIQFRNPGAGTASIQFMNINNSYVYIDDVKVGEYETAGDYTTAELTDHSDDLIDLEIETSDCDANNYIDRIEIIDNGAVVATYSDNIITNGTTTITEADLASGTFVGTTGTDIQIKLYLVGDGSNTPVVERFNAGYTINIDNNRQITREWRGTRLDQIIEELSSLSANEVFGANSNLVFFFQPRDLTSAPLSFSNNNILLGEHQTGETEAVDRVVIYFNDGNNAVTVTRFDRAADNQNEVGTVRPIMRTASYDHPEIVNEADAIEKGEAYLNKSEPLDIIHIDTLNFPDLEPGQVVSITSSDLNITDATEYVITEIKWDPTGLTKVKLIENTEGVIDILNKLQTEKTRVDMKTSDSAVQPVETNRVQQEVNIKITRLQMYIPNLLNGYFRFGRFAEGFGGPIIGGMFGSGFDELINVLDESY